MTSRNREQFRRIREGIEAAIARIDSGEVGDDELRRIEKMTVRLHATFDQMEARLAELNKQKAGGA